MKITSKEIAIKRLKEIRSENQKKCTSGRTPKPNGIEKLYQEIVNIPQMKYVGNDRSKDNRINFLNGANKYPDFRITFNGQSKFVEIVGTHSHPIEYSTHIKDSYRKINVPVLILLEPEIVNNPNAIRSQTINFLGNCFRCGSNLQSMGTEPPYCLKCGII
jgi:predicted nuclease of restriction endonuclease-like RecB superfamily